MAIDDQQIIRIEDKIDKISDRLSSIDSTLAAQHESLTHHIKRTDLLEESLKPIQKDVDMIKGAGKLIGIVAAAIGWLAGIIEVISNFKH